MNTSVRTRPICPRWLVLSLLTILLWGAWGFTTKVLSASLDVNFNQVLFTVGLAPLVALVVASPHARKPARARGGAGWAFTTGLLAGLGNIAFFVALAQGGAVSVVGPVTCLFPIVTTVLATTLMRERLSLQQKIGFVLGIPAIYLLVK